MFPTQSSMPQDPMVGMLQMQLTQLNDAVDASRDRHISLQRLRFQVMRLVPDGNPINKINKEISDELVNLESLRSSLVALRDTVRQTINQAVLPLLRPLKILDLPDELLRHIFLYVRGDTTMFELAFYDMSGGDVEQIKELRLTCRRFCENSSHLLMFYVKADMTPQSLARLDQISRHPTISKGIRAVKLCLGRHFDSEIAHDVRAFARYQATKLRSYVGNWDLSVRQPLGFERTPTEVFQRAIVRATPIAESFEEAAQHGLDETCPEHVLLRQAHEGYKQLYKAQLLLQRGPFAQAIVSSMTRMPTATWLSIQDEDPRATYGPNRISHIIFPEDLEDTETLRTKLQAYSTSWDIARYYGLGSPPIDVIPSILSSIGEAGIRLSGMDIRVPLPNNLSSFSTDTVEPSKLQALSQQMKAFTFRPRNVGALPTEAVPLITGFLHPIFQTSSLRRIDLCFDFMYMGNPDSRPTASMAPILLSSTWPNLKQLCFNGPFHLRDLQKVVDHVDKDVELEWSGYLIEGSWVEVLDVLRDCGLRAAKRLGDVNISIQGAECDVMSYEEKIFIFEEDTSNRHLHLGSRATRYIMGWTKQNPVTDWENGDLDMSHPTMDDEEDHESVAIAEG